MTSSKEGFNIASDLYEPDEKGNAAFVSAVPVEITRDF